MREERNWGNARREMPNGNFNLVRVGLRDELTQ